MLPPWPVRMAVFDAYVGMLEINFALSEAGRAHQDLAIELKRCGEAIGAISRELEKTDVRRDGSRVPIGGRGATKRLRRKKARAVWGDC
jgi:hypothetical protein